MANAHLSPRVGQHRDVVECAAHVTSTHVRVDVDDVAATSITACTVVWPVVGPVPRPVAREELGGDVPSSHLRTSSEVASDAVYPGP